MCMVLQGVHLRAGLGVLRLVGRAHAGGQDGVLGSQAPRSGAALLQRSSQGLRKVASCNTFQIIRLICGTCCLDCMHFLLGQHLQLQRAAVQIRTRATQLRLQRLCLGLRVGVGPWRV